MVDKMFNDLMLRMKEHDRWRAEECINLIPSENRTSPQVQMLLASDMSRRYTLPFNQEIHGSLVENAYRGTKYLDEVEALGERVACEVFGAKRASLKPLSGHVSALMALLATCERGDLLLAINAEHGGYDGYMPDYMPSFLGLEVGFLPFDEKSWNLNIGACIEMISQKKPKAVVIGASFILFPYELDGLSKVCKETGSILLYDASHVLGLMPWNFQDALDNGVDLVYGSTHKTFFGPQGGIVMTRDEALFEKVLQSTTWKVLDNAHWNRVAALAQALLEHREFGKAYGEQLVKNSRALAGELDGIGIPVKFKDMGYTRSHMVLLDTEELKSRHGLSANEFSVRLERSNIIVDSVGRMGACELTRMGAREEHMGRLASIIKDAISGNVKEDVGALRKELGLSFCP
jgi:glycine hydroxymethyltransferase